MRKKTWDDFTNYLKEQWTGFPPEIQQWGHRTARIGNKYVKPRVDGYMSGVATEGKRKAGELRFVGRFIVKKPKDPNKKRVSNKQFAVDMLLSKKEQEQIKAIPKYFDVDESIDTPNNVSQKKSRSK